MSILILGKFAPENLNYSTLPLMRGSGSECEFAKNTLGENLRSSVIHHRVRSLLHPSRSMVESVTLMVGTNDQEETLTSSRSLPSIVVDV